MKTENQVPIEAMNKLMLLETPRDLTPFMAMKLAIMNCTYFHQIENLADMYNHSEFCREDQDLLILLFYKYIDRLACVKDYNKICELKLKVIQ